MLISFLFCAFCTIILYAWGRLVLERIHQNRKNQHPFFVVYLVGLCTVSFFTNWITIFSGTNSLVGLFILVAPLIQQRRNLIQLKSFKEILPQSIPFKWLGLSLMLVGISMHAWEIKHPDTLAYQNMLIQNAISGPQPIGNIAIKNQLGYGGAWFPLAAIFSFEGLLGKTMTFVNLSLICVSVLFLIRRIELALNNQNLTSLTAYVLMLSIGCYEYTFFRLAITSAAPDTPAAIMGIATLLYFFKRERQSWILTGLSLTAVTFKLSLFPIVLLPAWLLFQKRNRNEWIKNICLGMLIMGAFITKNTMSTGYAVYPFSPSKILQNDFVPDKRNVQEEADYITAYARNVTTTKDPDRIKEIVSQKPGEWIPTWWNQLTGADRAAILLFFCGVIGCALSSHRSPMPKQIQIPAYLAVILGTFYWFTWAPAIRFGTTYLLAPLIIWAELLTFSPADGQRNKLNVHVVNGLMLAFTGVVLAYLLYRMLNYMDGTSLWVPKGPLP